MAFSEVLTIYSATAQGLASQFSAASGPAPDATLLFLTHS